MSKNKYKVKPPQDPKSGRIKNIVIFVLILFLMFSIICIFEAANINYEPVYNAVRENTDLKQRINELEKEIQELYDAAEKSNLDSEHSYEEETLDND